MIKQLTHVQVWVNDQDEALAFYTEKLGMEPRDMIRSLLANGASGGLFFTTDDIRSSYEQLKQRGVEFTQEPTEQPYGIDVGFRDPSGNHFRLMQPPGGTG